MSFDVYFQKFLDGEPKSGGGDRMRKVLQPYIVREEPEHRFALVECGDGSVNVNLGGDSMMANHFFGEDPWDLLLEGARQAGWVIMPVGCPTCLTEAAQLAHLPDGLDQDVVVVGTGADLLRIVRSS